LTKLRGSTQTVPFLGHSVGAFCLKMSIFIGLLPPFMLHDYTMNDVNTTTKSYSKIRKDRKVQPFSHTARAEALKTTCRE